MSAFLRLNLRDLINGLVVAVGAVVLGALQQALSQHGLDVASYDWNAILDMALTAAGAYLSKNLFTAKNGKVFGKI